MLTEIVCLRVNEESLMTVLDKSENCVLKESGGFTPSVLAENIRNLVEGGCNNEAVDSN